MPREGQAAVTITQYVWDKAKAYFEAHKKELKKKGIHSPSKLIQVWIEQRIAEG